jgi:glycolate oxidase FAD binding subunit
MMVAGERPREILEPRSVDEFAACLATLYAQERAFAFVGGGTELELGNPPRALDTLVRTTACNRVVDYAPQDQTVTVEAGMTVAAVAEVLAREGQFLAIDAPDPTRATIGGAIATNLFGGRRLRYGSIKDTIVGIEIVRPDGTRARGGGKVVKNVAGFDIPKLMVGSLGTLGAIVRATFRVYPIEEREAAVVVHDVSIEAVSRIAAEVVGEALVPASVVALDAASGGGYDCVIVFEGFARGVDEQTKATLAIAGRLGYRATADGADAVAEVRERERAARRAGAWRVAFAARPTELARFLATATLPASAARIVYPLLGAAFAGATVLDAPTIGAWRAQLDGGSVVVTAMPEHARGTVDSWGDAPKDALAIMRRLKANFDPKGLCSSGRFVGGI